MENTNSKQLVSQVQPAEAEIKEGKVVEENISLGKFKDVSTLLSAYNSLQSEFTKRCQKLKELEAKISSDKAEVPLETQIDKKHVDISEEDKDNILKDYLKGVLSKMDKSVVLGTDGIGLKTPVSKPKTIKEAGNLAKEIF